MINLSAILNYSRKRGVRLCAGAKSARKYDPDRRNLCPALALQILNLVQGNVLQDGAQVGA